MKIYISLPMSAAHMDHCRERAETARAMVERRGHQGVTPFDAFDSLGFPAYVGKSIEAMLGCDGIFLLTGWSFSPLCQTLWQAAQTYGKRVFTHVGQIMSTDEKGSQG